MDQRATGWIGSLEVRAERALNWCADNPWRAVFVLALLCLAFSAPGFFSRPPIDRTEVYYALSARHMIESGDWLVPHDPGRLAVGRPIGILWLQAVSALLFGPATLDAIWAYRLPSLAGAMLAAIGLFLGMRPLLGPKAALSAAALLAGSVILAIQSRLALPQAATLVVAIIAQGCLARLYTRDNVPPGVPTLPTALAFWAALGTAVLLNSWIVPILAALTVLGLAVQDRSLAWLRRLHAGFGVPLMLVLAAPWIASIVLSAGSDAGEHRSLIGWVALLADAQTMKYHAFPGSYLLMTWLGLWPALLYLLPAGRMVWEKRKVPAIRFLLAWLVPYLALMELVSHKPPLYMVAYIVPVLAIATAITVIGNPVTGQERPVTVETASAAAWAVLGLALALGAIGLQLAVGGGGVPPGMILAGIVSIAATLTAAVTARQGAARTALAFSLLSGAGVYWLVFALMVPTGSQYWPGRHMADLRQALKTCYPDPPLVVGYTEPSVYFLLGGTTAMAPAIAVPVYFESNPHGLAFIEKSEEGRLSGALQAPGVEAPVEIACIRGHNPFVNRSAQFRVLVKDPPSTDPACNVPARFRCKPRKPG